MRSSSSNESGESKNGFIKKKGFDLTWPRKWN